MRKKALRAAFPHTIPILAGFLFLGFSYGFLMTTKGFPVYLSLLMSVLVFAGSMQFVAVNLLLSAFQPLYAFLLTLMVNARHIFYGISMLEPFEGLGWKKYYLIFGLCDESFSIHCAAKIPPDVDRGWFMLFVTLLNQGYWVAGTALGAVAGHLIRFNAEGIDFALTALFVVIFVDQWRATKQHLSALIGVGAALCCRLVFGAEQFVLPAMGGIVLLFALARGRLQKEAEA